MKKVILAFSLMMFVGSFGTNAFASSNETQIEFRNDDDKKKKKKKKKSCAAKCATKCSADKSGAKATSSATPVKSCCAKKGH